MLWVKNSYIENWSTEEDWIITSDIKIAYWVRIWIPCYDYFQHKTQIWFYKKCLVLFDQQTDNNHKWPAGKATYILSNQLVNISREGKCKQDWNALETRIDVK